MSRKNKDGESNDQISRHIQDAFVAAFGFSLVKKRRPLLIYIHQNNRVPDLFCSEILIEFFRENYIVWSWDISNGSNRQILIKIWKEYFPEESFIDFSLDQCPMFIGVLRQPSLEHDSFFKYQSEVLLMGDVLVRTNEELDLEILLYQLIVFREEFQKNERYLSSDFVQKITSCPELVLQIAEYLSLNDAVATFSMGILSFLWKFNRKLPVIKPSEEFIRTISREKIISLHLEGSQFKRTMKSASSETFTNVKSLTIINLQELKQILEIRIHFPNVTFFSLRYDDGVDFHEVCKIFSLIPNSVKRFDIHCDWICCSHYNSKYFFTRITDFNQTVESFVLHVNQTSRSLVNSCAQAYKKCVLRTITDFIKILSNIRSVRIIINKSNIETLLDVAEWTTLIDMCMELEKITLIGKRNISRNAELIEQIEEIKNGIQNKRESIEFEVQIK